MNNFITIFQIIEIKKKIILLALPISILTACAPQITESSKVIPSQTQFSQPVPTHTFVPMPTTSATPTPLIGQVSIEHVQVIYYDITGSTESELRKSMNQLRPKDPYDNNRPVDAYTDWYISWNWPGYGIDTCDLTAAVVSYKIKLTVPRWQAPANASHELIAKWDKYIQSLVLHEKGHVENVVNNYLSVKTAIQSATCTTADAAGQKALEPLRKFDSSYDSETKHGATQGAIFP